MTYNPGAFGLLILASAALAAARLIIVLLGVTS